MTRCVGCGWPAPPGLHRPLGARLAAARREHGDLFIRSYERGERVHLAMVSRGWSGRMPVIAPLVATPAQWALALAPAAVAAVVTVGVRLG